MSKAWPDDWNKEHIYQFQPEPTKNLENVAEACRLEIIYYGKSLRWSCRASQSAQE